MVTRPILAALALALAVPALSTPALAATYGPPDPAAATTPPAEPAFAWPQTMTVGRDETLEQAQHRIERIRRDATRWEIAYQVLNLVDTVQTIECLERRVCSEGNPLFGKRPSAGKLIAVKGGVGLVHWLLFQRLRRDDPAKARTMARISVALQGTIVAANARFAF